MLIRKKVLEDIRDGKITLAFRRWQRPTVKTGGTLLTALGQLQIRKVSKVAVKSITEEQARKAGYSSRETLLKELSQREKGEVYRVEFGEMSPDPRIALRETPPTEEEIDEIAQRLRRIDSLSGWGAWTQRVLEVLATHPAVRANDLCELAGQDKDAFKQNVRRLKGMGLTQSLGVGYRLSPRGWDVLEALRAGPKRR